ncbi:MAG: DUF4331 family protein, partial [Actinomycetota bacterium]
MKGKLGIGTALAVSAIALALAVPAMFGFGADHLDAPGLTPPSGRLDADINDVFVFEGSNASRTAIAMTTHPAVGVFSPAEYATDVRYIINVDRTGDAVQDLAYVFRFAARDDGESQHYTVTRYTGSNARTLRQGVKLGSGSTGEVGSLKGSGRVFAGLRSDPFFFDLAAFRDDVLGTDLGRSFCDQPGGDGVDFFESLNTNAIVIEFPDGALGDDIGVWGATRDSSGQIDRMGRPAINTVFNPSADKNSYNHGQPKDDFEDFSDNVIGVLKALGGYTTEQATGLAHVLLPDLVTYDTDTHAVGPLNGRAPADDVIDAELSIVTQGGLAGDCVGPH